MGEQGDRVWDIIEKVGARMWPKGCARSARSASLVSIA
jgi:hypothetical protein